MCFCEAEDLLCNNSFPITADLERNAVLYYELLAVPYPLPCAYGPLDL